MVSTAVSQGCNDVSHSHSAFANGAKPFGHVPHREASITPATDPPRRESRARPDCLRPEWSRATYGSRYGKTLFSSQGPVRSLPHLASDGGGSPCTGSPHTHPQGARGRPHSTWHRKRSRARGRGTERTVATHGHHGNPYRTGTRGNPGNRGTPTGRVRPEAASDADHPHAWGGSHPPNRDRTTDATGA